MAENKMSTELFACCKRTLKIHAGASFERGERGFANGFGGQIRGKSFLIAVYNRKAATIHRNASGDGEMRSKRRSGDGEPAAGRTRFEAGDGTKMLNNSSKHSGS